MTLSSYIRAMPKAELHLHIEGTLTPELLWKLADKYKHPLPFDSVEAIRQAYDFDSLQSFLDLYYEGAAVLREEADFHALMWEYLKTCRDENIVHAEIMFDPQTHTERGIGFDIFMPGFLSALNRAKREWGMSTSLIMCFLRHLSEEAAFDTLEQARPWYNHIQAVGLDSSEMGHPPSKFTRVFRAAADAGFLLVAHAGEEGPPSYIREAIYELNIARIDHGVRCQEDDALLALIRERQIPLTVCPLSNLKLCVIDDMKEHNILDLLEAGLLVTVNSDDPTYFGGFLSENFDALEQSLGMNLDQCRQLIENSFTGSFLPAEDKQRLIANLNEAHDAFVSEV